MEEMLFTGSCFADAIGHRFVEEQFRAVVNPFGVMYNPASILHTVERTDATPRTAVFTLGTNHVYILNETGKIVDNCQKRPQRLFTEKELSIDECFDYLERAFLSLQKRRDDVRLVITVSPIRYAKYGYHGSRLSKAVLLLAADRLVKKFPDVCYYFPAYEIMNDELRDYRFYKPDMLHPSNQAVEYIWQQFHDNLLSDAARQFIAEYQPIKKAFAHRPFNPEAEEYKLFIQKAEEDFKALKEKYAEFLK